MIEQYERLTVAELDAIRDMIEIAIQTPGFIDTTSGGGVSAEREREMLAEMSSLMDKVSRIATARRNTTADLMAIAWSAADDCDTCWYLITDTALAEHGQERITTMLRKHVDSGHLLTSEEV